MPRFDNAYALIIGINSYQHISPLAKAVNDATDVSKLLIDENACGYHPDNVRLLTDTEATRPAFFEAMNWLTEKADSASTVTIFFSGHGGQSPVDGVEGYLLLHDSNPWSAENPLQVDVGRLGETAVATREFTAALNQIKAQKITVIFDACHSGGFANPKSPFFNRQLLQRGLPEQTYDALKRGKGRVIIASCTPDQVSWEQETMRNSVFTAVLLRALRGEAIREDGVHVLDLFFHLEVHVPKMLDSVQIFDPIKGQWAQQTPLLKAETTNNYLIALTRLPDTTGDSISTTPVFPSVDPSEEVRKYYIFLVELLDLLDRHFDQEELKTLCFRLNVQYDNLRGEGKNNKARELITRMERENRLPALLAELDKMRPTVLWTKNKPEDAKVSTKIPSIQPSSEKPKGSSHTPAPSNSIKFSNQKRALWAIEQQLISSEPYVFITATAQMGKSYLLNELKRRCTTGELQPNPTNGDDGPQKWFCACINLKDAGKKLTTPQELITQLSNALRGSSATNGSGLARQIRVHEQQAEERVLFLINGTEQLTEAVAEAFHSLLGDLENRLGEKPKFKPAVVAAGRLSHPSWENSYSPKMKSVEIEPFSATSIEEILLKVRASKGVRANWYEDQAKQIYACTAGHPGCIAAMVQHLYENHWTIPDPNDDSKFLEVIAPIIHKDVLVPHNLDGHGTTNGVDYEQLSRVFLELSTYRIITPELIEDVAQKLGLETDKENLMGLEEHIVNSLLVKWDSDRGWDVMSRSVRRLLERWVTIIHEDRLERHRYASAIYNEWLDRSKDRPALEFGSLGKGIEKGMSLL